MRRWSACLPLLVLCALGVSALGPGALSWRFGSAVRTEDNNHDGRPDVWRAYDRDGNLARVSVDTNFDGRSDVQEFYEFGALVRREFDRDFNDRTDLVQDFDARTGQSVRSVEDVDFDGTADLLVLFKDGQPVFTKWASRVDRISAGIAASPRAAPARSADDRLAPLDDPFRGDLAIRAAAVQPGSDECVELSTSTAIVAPRSPVPAQASPSIVLSDVSVSDERSGFGEPYCPRGPPASSSI